VGGGGVGTSGRREDVGKGRRRNTVQLLGTRVCKWKNETLKLFQEWGEGRIKENGRGMEGLNSSMMYLIYCKNFCKCHNVPHPTHTHTHKSLKLFGIFSPSFVHLASSACPSSFLACVLEFWEKRTL
jgi:hypothetical protein